MKGFRNILNLLLLSVFTLGYWQAEAHPMPNTVINLSVLDGVVKGEAKIPYLEIETAIKHNIDDMNSAEIHQYFIDHIVAVSDNNNWKTEIENIEVIKDTDPFVGEYKEVILHFKLTPPDVSQLRNFTFDYDAVIHQVVTHQILVFLKSDWENGLLEEDKSMPIGVIKMDVKSGNIYPLEVNLEKGSWLQGAKAMFMFGMKHIQEGLDHILFLLTLLLIAPLAIDHNHWSGYQGIKYTVVRFLKISFAFTVGHSITLLAGSLNIIDFRVQYIEVLIALSIFISAINCIKPVFFKKEILIAGGFGLIHGLAFSLSLSGMDLNFGSKMLSILGFNLGIEAMQIIIMLCFFPILLVSKWNFYTIVRGAFAICTMVVSIAWVVERISNHENIITAYVNSLL